MVTPLSEEHKVLYLNSMFFGVGQSRDRSYWRAERTFGLVDWVEASIGPAWLDVARCCTNLALVDEAATDAFASTYAELTGRDPAPYWDGVMDVFGFLPSPGRTTACVVDPDRDARRASLERRIVRVMGRLR